ncbi:hypothetical protein AaE_012088 [Aphanomyces astaci]|nr:hypothetical protein AaE_012088 [Aphanomyces astaci]
MEAHFRHVQQCRMDDDATWLRRERLQEEIRALPSDQRTLLKAIMRREMGFSCEPTPTQDDITLPSIEVCKMKTYVDMVERLPNAPPLRFKTKWPAMARKVQQRRWVKAMKIGRARDAVVVS